MPRSDASSARTGLAQKGDKVQPSDEPASYERRIFLLAAATLAATVPPAVESISHIVKKVSSLPVFSNLSFETERTNRIRKLIFPRFGELDLVPARDHPILGPPPEGHTTYGNEEFAQEAILRIFPGMARESVDNMYPVEPGHSIVCLGASISNLLTRRLLGSNNKPAFTFFGSNWQIEFPYSIATLPGSSVRRLQDGNPDYCVPNNAIVSKSEYVACPEVDATGTLRTDFLLVTRVPSELGRTEQLLLTPTHGPGMRAVKKLLFEIGREDLDYLEEIVAGPEPYFQAIFQIGDLYEENGTTHPGSIRLLRSESTGPRRLRIKY